MEVKLVVIKGSRHTQAIQLRARETLVGRQRGCGLRIPSAEVSRRHCRLCFQDDYLIIEDLNSSNGSYLNGARVRGLEIVRPGDQLEIGPVTFRVEYQLTPRAINALLQPQAPAPFAEISPELSVEEPEPVAPAGAPSDNDVMFAFDAEEGWQMPQGEDLNALLLEYDQDAAKPAGAAEEIASPTIPPRAAASPPPAPQAPGKQEDDIPTLSVGEGWQLPEGEDLNDILSEFGDR